MPAEHHQPLPRLFVLLLLLLSTLVSLSDSGAVQLDPSNIDSVLANNEFVFINFYADWCRFSNLLAPIWDEGADKIAAEVSHT
jgi:endoplasmic reticulum resident protein 44